MRPPDAATAAAPADPNRCSCCPFGYHFDLDFVAFAEDVVAGRNKENQSRRATPDHRRLNGTATSPRDSPHAFHSVPPKRSYNDVVADLTDLSKKPPSVGDWTPIRRSPSRDSAQSPIERRNNKTPLTVAANEEIQAILERPSRSLTAATSRRSSAPGSPTSAPKTYYTAIGQSLAALTNRTPVSQISSSFGGSPSVVSTLSRQIPSSATKPPLPSRRHRVLSPDPSAIQTIAQLRSSNLQNRSFFRTSAASPLAASPPSSPIIRSQYSRSLFSNGSSLFDSFASVRRSRGFESGDSSRALSPVTPTATSPIRQLNGISSKTENILSNRSTQTLPNSLNDSEVQTNRIYFKNIGIGTLESKRRDVASTASPSLTTIGVGTIEPKLTVEFQYCIGHESEHLITDIPIKEKKTKEVSTWVVPKTTETGTNPTQPKGIPISTQTTEHKTKTTETQTQKIKEEKKKTAEKSTETEEEEEEAEFIMITCAKCSRQTEAPEHYEKIRFEKIIEEEEEPPASLAKSPKSLSDEGLELIDPLEVEINEEKPIPKPSPPVILSSPRPLSDKSSLDEDEKEMLANLDQLASLDPDRFSVDTDVQTVICVHPNQEGQRQLDPTRAEAIRKLLTEPNRVPFQRESGANRSYRVDKSKAHDLDWILNKHSTEKKIEAAQPSTPSDDPEKALKEMVVLKKFVAVPSAVPEPIPARIPRPKFSKYSHESTEAAETPDEAAEAADKLTPLRSELQSLWRSGGSYRPSFRHHRFPDFPTTSNSAPPPQLPDMFSDDDDEMNVFDPNDPLSTSSNSSLTSDEVELDADDETPATFELTVPLREALETLQRHQTEPKQSADWANKYVQHEWLKIATRKAANAESVERFIDALESFTPNLMESVVNFSDQNGNTALHYAVSHENYDVVSVLLDAKVCRVDETNQAGYSPVMLAALCAIRDETESAIVQRLFERGNVNAKAIYHGQTALMLAVSHGRIETTNLLLNCGADDIDGSTALMCAAEHGHKELIKILLKRNSIDASLMDCDNQTALSIAVENGHRDIGVLIYAHLNFSRTEHESGSL